MRKNLGALAVVVAIGLVTAGVIAGELQPTSPTTSIGAGDEIVAAPTATAGTAWPSATPVQSAAPGPASPTVEGPASTQGPTATPPHRSPTPTVVSKPPMRTTRIFLGYYVPYDATSWWSFAAQAPRGTIDVVNPQWLSIDACGNLASRDDRTLVAFARAQGVRVLPTLLTSSAWLNHQILTDVETAAHAIEQIVAYVVDGGYDGFDLDLEDVQPADRAALTRFVDQLSVALRARGKLLTMALPPKRADVRTGWSGAFDYAALAPHLDLAIIMAYAYTTAASAPGSTAPQQWVESVVAYAASVMPPKKILLGVPFYGYDWNLTLGGARALRYPQAAAIAEAYGATIANDPASRSATFNYTSIAGQRAPTEPTPPPFSHEIVERKPPACDRRPPTPIPAPSATPTPTPVPGTILQHVVWIENAASVEARLTLANRYGLAGVAVWRLGQEDPAVWPVIERWRQGG